MNELATIGFTSKSAQQFFALLRDHQVTLVADVRLSNRGQLAGYTKADDLAFFLSLFGMKYEHWTDFAPTKELRTRYHADHDFAKYETAYGELITDRKSLEKLQVEVFTSERVCLLCSEASPDRCHRRIAAELIANVIPGLHVRHL